MGSLPSKKTIRLAPLNTNDLQIFITVAELGSFSKAATAMDVPKVHVSRRIAELEKQLNTRLFNRTTRSISLTSGGERYLSNIKPHVLALDKASNMFNQDSNGGLNGTLRIGILPYLEVMIDTELSALIHQNKGLTLDIYSISSGYKEITRLGLDLLIDVGTLEDSNFIAKKIDTMKRKLYASPSYLAKSSQIEYIDDLIHHTYLCYRLSNGKPDVDIGLGTNLKPKAICNSFHQLLNLVVSGAGIAILPVFVGEKHVKEGSLISVLPDFSGSDLDMNILYPNREYLSEAAKKFIDSTLSAYDGYTKNTLCT